MVGKFDGVMVMNMDVLIILAVGGKEMSVVFIGDYFNGNDGIVLKDVILLVDIKGC